MPAPPDIRIDLPRLRHSLLGLAEIGATPKGGVSRLALTDEDRRGRDRLVAWLAEAGLAVTIDEMGNIFGRREGTDGTLPPVLLGSHIDTVPQGGKLDGALGVMAALEVVRTLNDRGLRTRHPLEVVSFTNEEGVRFQPSMIGSAVLAGVHARDFAYARPDKQGVTFGEALRSIGYVGPALCARREFHAYLECHIEQGPVLIGEGVPIGIVEGITGLTWLQVTLEGQADHAGPTPMGMRRDALMAAARIVTAVREIPGRVGPGTVATVGSLDVVPNAVNIIPGRVTLTVDVRNPDGALMAQAVSLATEAAERAAQDEGVQLAIETLHRVEPTPFQPEVVAAVERAGQALGYATRRMWSGAGHDAKYMADIARAGMIFVPSIDGKSHCEEEASDWADIEKGANVLLHAALDLAA